MAARRVKVLPEGKEWLYEPKLDGYRALLLKDGKRIRILSRNEKDLTPIYPAVAAGGLRLNAADAVIDGEIVALAEDGRPSFQALQHRSSHPQHRVVFYAFDVVHLDGRDLMAEPLLARRGLLPKVIGTIQSFGCRRSCLGLPFRSYGRCRRRESRARSPSAKARATSPASAVAIGSS
jgi:bifunctional non-homologous end joining protein LigD